MCESKGDLKQTKYVTRKVNTNLEEVVAKDQSVNNMKQTLALVVLQMLI